MAAPDRAGGLVPEPSSLVTTHRAPVSLGSRQRAAPPSVGTGRLPASEGRLRARGWTNNAMMEEYAISRASVFRYLQSEKR
jgi:hypothetical protein